MICCEKKVVLGTCDCEEITTDKKQNDFNKRRWHPVSFDLGEIEAKFVSSNIVKYPMTIADKTKLKWLFNHAISTTFWEDQFIVGLIRQEEISLAQREKLDEIYQKQRGVRRYFSVAPKRWVDIMKKHPKYIGH